MRGQPNQWQSPLGFLDNGHSVRVLELYDPNQRPWLRRGSQQARGTYYYPAGVSGTRDTVWVAGWFTGPHGHLNARMTQMMFDRLLPRTFATSASALSWLHRWFAARGIGYRIAYQPASHYWPIQAMLGVILLALAMLAGCGAILLSQRGGALPAAVGTRRRAGLRNARPESRCGCRSGSEGRFAVYGGLRSGCVPPTPRRDRAGRPSR
jgi:hypothetical protein